MTILIPVCKPMEGEELKLGKWAIFHEQIEISLQWSVTNYFFNKLQTIQTFTAHLERSVKVIRKELIK